MQEPEACLGHCQTSAMNLLCKNVNGWKLLTIFAKKLYHRYLTGSSIRLWDYTSILYFSWAARWILNFPFYLNLCLRVSRGVFRTPNFGKYEQIGANFLKMFRQIYLRINKLINSKVLNTIIQIWNCSENGFCDCIDFLNKSCPCCLTYWLV